MPAFSSIVHAGLLLPSTFLDSRFFSVFAAFVAINTVIYVVLAVVKMLPRVHLSDFLPGRNRRAEERSIYPAGMDRREAGSTDRVRP